MPHTLSSRFDAYQDALPQAFVMRENETFDVTVQWTDGAGALDITGGTVEAYTRDSRKIDRPIPTVISNAAAGEVTLSAEPRFFAEGLHRVQGVLTLGGHTQVIEFRVDVRPGFGVLTPIPPAIDVSNALPSVIRVGDVVAPIAPALTGRPDPSIDSAVLTFGGVPVATPFTVTGLGEIVYTVSASNSEGSEQASVTRTVQASLAPPSFTSPPSITPASGPVGTRFTLFEGIASGSPAPTLTTALSLDGAPVTPGGMSYTSTATGSLRWTVTATNAEGNATATATARVDAAPAFPPDIVFIVAGQSNAVGQAAIADLSDFEDYPAGVREFRGDGSVAQAAAPLDHPASGTGGKFGPDLYFVRDWVARRPGDNVLLLPAAQGSTGFSTGQWKAPTGVRYASLIERINALKAARPNAVFAGVIWHQGENDAPSMSAADYEADLRALMAGVRAATGVADLPFFLGDMAPIYVGTGPQQAFAAMDGVDGAFYVRLPGAGTSDGTHFNAPSMRVAGWNLAQRAFDVMSAAYPEEASVEPVVRVLGTEAFFSTGDTTAWDLSPPSGSSKVIAAVYWQSTTDDPTGITLGSTQGTLVGAIEETGFNGDKTAVYEFDAPDGVTLAIAWPGSAPVNVSVSTFYVANGGRASLRGSRTELVTTPDTFTLQGGLIAVVLGRRFGTVSIDWPGLSSISSRTGSVKHAFGTAYSGSGTVAVSASDDARLALLEVDVAEILEATLTTTVDDYARDGVLFDTLGAGTASIPVSGTTTAPDGASIEARVERLDGSVVTQWATVGQASAGKYSGTVAKVPATAAELRVVTRVRDGGALPATHGGYILAGYKIAFWMQSEGFRSYGVAFQDDGAQSPPLASQIALQLIAAEDRGSGYDAPDALIDTMITDTSRVSRHMATIANACWAAYNVPMAFEFHAVGGTGRGTAAGGLPGDKRNLLGEQAIHAASTPHAGMEPGVSIESWFFNDLFDVEGEAFVDRALAFAIGQNRSGEADTRYPVTLFPDYYDATYTTHVMSLHRYDGDNGNEVKLPGTRRALDDYFASGTVPSHLVRGYDPMIYMNDATDAAHPQRNDRTGDGQSKLIVELVAAALQGKGVETWSPPEFDNAQLAPDNTYLEVWSSAGPVTTTRWIDGDALPAGRPQVWGFRQGADIIERADIVGGRVRLFPNGGGAWTGPGVSFDSGGGAREDYTNSGREYESQGSIGFDGLQDEVWRDHPVVDLGGNGPAILNGIVGVRPSTDPALFDAALPSFAIPPNPNPNPNLAPPRIVSGEATPDRSNLHGWSGGVGVWTFNGDGTVTSAAAQANCEPVLFSNNDGEANKDAVEDVDLEFSFHVLPTGSPSGNLFVQIKTGGSGGGATIATQSTNPIPSGGGRIVVPFNVPASNSNRRIEVLMRRDGSESGDMTIADIAIQAAAL